MGKLRRRPGVQGRERPVRVILVSCSAVTHTHNSATKGLGRTQPGAWQDAGEALGNPELKGVHMPKGSAVDIPNTDASLQYNEVSRFVFYVLTLLD